MRRLALTAAAACAAGGLIPLGSAVAEQSGAAEQPSAIRAAAPADSACFWTGPFVSDNDELNFAYLDTKALYWASHYTLPEGARLTLDGKHPHARYQSLNSYDATTAAPLTALNDQQIQPDKGSRNPFLPGAKRTFPQRDWTVEVSPKAPPQDPA
ncbi:hypothetical protein [Streptomyces sp. NBC_00063]|uniref:hypothetical protein n=1 Tax=Streptomyces sp. NBC_00063 TaxID=2975638 RepID=UPI003D7286E4